MSNEITRNNLIDKISELLKTARNSVISTVNQTIVFTYYEIGRMIVEEEQNGKEKADYGKQLISDISKKLTNDFGRGFSSTNIKQMRSFYLIYSKGQTLSDEFKLSWSHYLKLMRIEDANERKFYEIESYKNNWSLRELQRQYDSALYTRLALSRDKDKILELSTKGQILEQPKDAVKDPYVLEFLGLEEKAEYSESELEQKLIDKLGHFLLELGTGFTFVARQKRITFEEKHFRIDLVFYNRILKCFVLIDLKIGELKHQDIGQMQMYVNYYDREMRLQDENKTIGIILCQDKNEAIVRYTLPENNEQIFASQYLTVLPSKEDLKQLLESNE
ncbi:PDDEXK nuclease domain-containing protein [Odoribacter sp. OttesenSCG-928-L07]|nr:PDDEXK nuclease domain-containing protein [Odoribacter sp. OttesenSCG-928-L07]MDL2239095.1 PDDEXK nuclease domain-containing protein [Bacteroidales bacterium OttesenSCG-928-L14]MDL2240008.1 PDDEXK nuclease domain-containing protein [Bacteroidales bacterium OttesenSCG-928-K22]